MNARLGELAEHSAAGLRASLFFEFAGQQFEIDDEYASVVNAADAEISTGAGLPPDPFPEL